MILLLGASGYVGSAFRRFFDAQGIPCAGVSRKEWDYTQVDPLLALLRSRRPKLLINSAGYTGKPNVDACEIRRWECLDGNAVLPGKIAQACEAADVPWIHVSSGCIYSGSPPKGGGFREEDPPNFTFRQNNCSFYSGTKALGEEILRNAPRCYILRLRIPFNHTDQERNYLTKLMRYPRLLEARNSLSELDEFARAAWECYAQRIPFGVYNATNPGSITTREVVEMIRKSGVCAKKFDFFESEAEFMAKAAKTPRSNCVLDSQKLARAGVVMTEVHEAIARALREWRS